MNNTAQTTLISRPLPRIAIVGTGPSGLYSLEHLLMEFDEKVEVDLYDRLPTPWGMVRSAVAPDHLVKKQIIETSFTALLNHKHVRFFGNVRVGEHVQPHELADWYDAVIYASGADGDTRMNIPGEDLSGCVGAREFVHWYNGHPDFSDRKFDLSHKRAIIVGNGNVAMDVARILTLEPNELQKSDMPSYAIEALSKSAIKEVVILGRRGQAQAAYHRPELEEFEHLDGVEVTLEGEALITKDQADYAKCDWHSRKKIDTLHRLLNRKVANPRKRIVLNFLASPIAVIGTEKAESIEVARNELIDDGSGKIRAKTTDEKFKLETGLIMRAIGFRAQPFVGLPFDSDRNVLRNQDGRVQSASRDSQEEKLGAGIYVTGWLKRGPRGLIGTNRLCALETVECLLKDFSNGLLSGKLNGDQVLETLLERQPKIVERDQWWSIDRFEREAGGTTRPRDKLVNFSALLDCAFNKANLL